MSKNNEHIWIPFTDLMSVLMLVFLLLIVIILSLIPREDLESKLKVKEFEQVTLDLYEELDKALSPKKEEWGIEVSEDLTVKFNNTEVLFNQDSSLIRKEFEKILDEFIPIYFTIINKEKYNESVKEVKIEGHTAATSPIHNTYIKTVKLSQDRSRSILEYILNHSWFTNLSEKNSNKIIFWLSPNGFGYGRAVDKFGEYVYHSNNTISPISRRVEFRIITSTDELVEEIIKRN